MRILVLRALGLGDLLTAVPALKALRRAFSRAQIELACPEWLHELVRLWRLADVPIAVGPLEPIPAAFAESDVAVNLHGRGPESTRLLLASGPRRLVAFRSAAIPATQRLPRWRAGEHEVERWCRLLRGCGVEAHAEQLDLDPPHVDDAYVGCTVLHPGAASGARRWPAERWAVVARAETFAGQRVVLTGSDDERALCFRIAALAGLPPESVHAGGSLVELAALVGGAGLVVCGDTGVAHLATAFRTPSVILFGPVRPAEWGPPESRRHLHRVLWAGHVGDPHAEGADPGLLELRPARVLAEIDSLRTSATRPAPARARVARASRPPSRR